MSNSYGSKGSWSYSNSDVDPKDGLMIERKRRKKKENNKGVRT
jgi:hypothetical protein